MTVSFERATRVRAPIACRSSRPTDRWGCSSNPCCDGTCGGSSIGGTSSSRRLPSRNSAPSRRFRPARIRSEAWRSRSGRCASRPRSRPSCVGSWTRFRSWVIRMPATSSPAIPRSRHCPATSKRSRSGSSRRTVGGSPMGCRIRVPLRQRPKRSATSSVSPSSPTTSCSRAERTARWRSRWRPCWIPATRSCSSARRGSSTRR